MKNTILLPLAFALMLAPPALLNAEDDDENSKLSAEISVGAMSTDGRRKSAKAEEYRDLSNGVTSDFSLKYDDKSSDQYATFSGESFGREDQKAELSAGTYGKYKIELGYSELPHRLSYGASSIYSGAGSDSLTIADSVKSSVNSATSPADLANRLNEAVAAQEHSLDYETLRKTGKLKVQFQDLKPFNFTLDISSENRSGERPLMSSFGYGNVVELVAPIDYNTSQLRFSGEYNSRNFLGLVGYNLSVFQNDTEVLRFDNPYRASDSTSSSAHTVPYFSDRTFVNNGPARGAVGLAADNLYHGPSATAAIRNLPWKSQITLAGSWGWMEQDNPFLPYTSNTAVTGSDGAGVFDASNITSLPEEDTDTLVSTALYNVGITTHPLSWLDATAKYRYYDYSNETDQITFPGYVIADSSWVSQSVTTNPSSYTKQNVGVDLSAKLTDFTRFGVLYKYIDTHRDNREVEDQSENIVGASLDHQWDELLNLRTSYERSERDIGSYDFTQPYLGEDMPSQLPLLRKYDEASRNMDSVRVLATLSPMSALDVSTGLLYGNSNYDESAFGMLDDRNYQISGDVDYRVTKWLGLKTFYSYERHIGTQAARAWTPDSFGDPYQVDRGTFSTSNWTAETEDHIHTIGGGLSLTFIPKKMFLDLNYEYMLAEGNISLDSPLGAASSDANAFVPGDFSTVDRSRGQRFTPSLRYRVTKQGTITVGYLWEKYSFDDYQASGFSAVPTSASGGVNGAILGGAYLLKDYEINMLFASLRYRF